MKEIKQNTATTIEVYKSKMSASILLTQHSAMGTDQIYVERSSIPSLIKVLQEEIEK